MVEFVLQLEGFNLPQMGLELGTGGLIGGIIGFAAKKIAKIIAVIVGLELALFKFLETRGILEVNWQAIGGAAQNATQGATSAAGGQPPSWMMSIISALPVSAGFTGGFLVGFKQG
ncbi:FUN14 domain-containing protein [Haloarcula nitratireducens]|uniref:FUN14 domain-containing protein n=1 Tax=Haloarcula nitratireducens TaxID=2487749 RepID=A0AAW4P892_9EURY|nr:FUN14 domain-containing protein [Halomicroarcula nitratireducens]MBX0293750.1 FUN14 domain-containing protein [Halomicroarcula nitratireducens]